MNSLILTLALSSPQSAVAHPPAPPVQYRPPVVSPYLPGFPPVVAPRYPGHPAFSPPFAPGAPTPGYPHRHRHRVMTLQEFAHCFTPTPGLHHVWIVHPVTCRPVEVCFRLPHGHCRPKVDVDRRSIEFDYGRDEIEIEFRRNGTVHVDYD